jgi:uncharacterized protein YkwD
MLIRWLWALGLLLALGCAPGVHARPKTIAIPPTPQDQTTSSSWNNALYQRLDAAGFAQFAPANRPIVRGQVDRPLLAAAIFYATNEQRAGQGRNPFQYYGALAQVATGHSESMASRGFFSHVNPIEKDRRTMGDRFRLKKIPKGLWGENIGLNPVDERGGESYLAFARSMVGQWMASRGHRANILNPKLNFLGCGVAITEINGFLYVIATQNFSRNADQ